MPDAAAEDHVDFLDVIAIGKKGAEVDGRLADETCGDPAFRAVGSEGGGEFRRPSEFLEGHSGRRVAIGAALSIPTFPLPVAEGNP
jgi:hypothetical protein